MSSKKNIGYYAVSKSSMSRNAATPCALLIRNKQCLDPDCHFSHMPWRVREWQNGQGNKPCNFGHKCLYFRLRHCLYYHPPEHLQVDVQDNREEVITLGLQKLHPLALNSLVADQNVTIEDLGDLASFNKVADNEIAVPGSPPLFHPLTRRIEVKLDSHNGTLSPQPNYTYPFEPLIRSIQVSNPTHSIFGADIVSNASNLRKLFHIFRNQKQITERYDLEWKGDTLFLGKWTGDPSLRLSYGHGFGFERETCRYDPDGDAQMLRDSATHHRVVGYKFGGLQCVVQSEVDAYHCDCSHPPSPAPVIMPSPSRDSATPTRSPFLTGSARATVDPSQPAPSRASHKKAASTGSSSFRNPAQKSKVSTPTRRFTFDALALDDPGDSPSFAAAQLQTLRTHRCGRDIPSACLVEVKTHREGKNPTFSHEAQLYFSRRTKLYVAEHRAGVFDPGPGARSMAVQDQADALVRWETENQATLGQMAALLRLLRAETKGMDNRVSLICECDGRGEKAGRVNATLYLRTDGARLLPPEI
ncbi:hypothetical protein QBC46DRAFT_398141 [Diplogelasinospora grovesii]|uniref:Uncharacterized protein n=1 Tax=Diplogelasinospora grovesii TaxID=303347 RepID=A0AAN6MY19_9PEZI|nr:hypothetical protein QBC46DRAFT_398141 [Diplogelasinospora grovesii]